MTIVQSGPEIDHMNLQNKKKSRLTLKESLFLGFCAILIVLFRMVFRLHLNISGHSMLFTLFFLMLAKACVKRQFSATYTGMLSGAMAMILGLGKGGPMIMLKFLLPAMAIDIMVFAMPFWYESYWQCLILAAIAASTKFINTLIIDLLVGMDITVALQHGVLESVFACLFGMAGGLCIPPVVKKLNAHGIIDHYL